MDDPELLRYGLIAPFRLCGADLSVPNPATDGDVLLHAIPLLPSQSPSFARANAGQRHNRHGS
jgi:hypothetical protein